MNNEVKHYGVPGMRWGIRNKLGSNFRKSLKQKYGPNAGKKLEKLASSFKQKSVKALIIGKATGENTLRFAAAFGVTYGALKVSELAVNTLPKIAWATGKVISNSPIK